MKLRKLGCNSKDNEVIYKFKEEVQSKNSIKKTTIVNKKSVSEKTTLSLSSKHMFLVLQKYGFETKKSGKEILSNLISQNLRRHFIRGFFDGDGITCVGKSKRSGFISSKEMLLSIMHELNLYKTLTHPKNTALENIYYILFGKKESKILYDYIYEDSSFFLKRKKERMDVIIKTTPRKLK